MKTWPGILHLPELCFKNEGALKTCLDKPRTRALVTPSPALHGVLEGTFQLKLQTQTQPLAHEAHRRGQVPLTLEPPEEGTRAVQTCVGRWSGPHRRTQGDVMLYNGT